MSRRHSRRLSRWPRRGGGPCGGGEGAAARAARERHENGRWRARAPRGVNERLLKKKTEVKTEQ